MARPPRSRVRVLPPILRDLETEPIRQDWLLLSPGRRLALAWKMRRFLKDPEALHDERSLPRL
ncbi:MAG TPA: hypothetical protein VE981_19020 [Planctomycetota bacterium]|nr:hypothetical protein [Planctomycetota bacterium]